MNNKKSFFLQKIMPILMIINFIAIVVLALIIIPKQIKEIEDNRIAEQQRQEFDKKIKEDEEYHQQVAARQAQEEAEANKITIMYVAKDKIIVRATPNDKAYILATYKLNREVQVIGKPEDGWYKIKMSEDSSGYIRTDLLSLEKVQKTTSRSEEKARLFTNAHHSNNSTIAPTSQKKNSGGKLTKAKGVNYFNGYRETWYSQKVLPGKGLRIPGRHVAADGTVRDKDNYICVASNDFKKGTVVQTSLGAGKVYDCGCASGTIDIYVNW